MYTSKSDLSHDYMPSLHSKRFNDHAQPDQAVLEHFISLTLKQTEEICSKHGISVRANVRYAGQDDRQLVDIYYRGAEDAPAPLFIFIHGGYWQMMDKSTAGSFVAPLVKRGYRVLVMDYNLCPQVTLSELMKQFGDFLSWVFQYARETQATELSLAGHSAGAHLLALLLNTPALATEQHVRQIKAIFLICGVYDLRELWSLENVNPSNILRLDAATAEALSPCCWIYGCVSAYKQLRTPVHVLAAENESETFVNQTVAYAKVLSDLGVNAQVKVFEKYDHFDILEEGAKEQTAITSYMRQVLGK